jgi:U3 small nucleolar RNA-associated protein 18
MEDLQSNLTHTINNVKQNSKWVDEEDEQIEISLNKKNNLKKLKKENNEDKISGAEFQERLRDQYKKMNQGADIYKWAFESTEDENNLADQNNENYIESLLRTNKNLTEGEINIKDTNFLRITQLADLNKGHHHNSIVSTLSFHPTKDNIAYTTGLDKKLKLFSIDSNDNTSSLVQTVNTQDIPILSAKFINSSEILISGRRKHYFIYNTENSKLERCNGLFSHHKEINSLEKLFVGESNYAFGTDQGYILIYDKFNKTFRYDIKISGSVNSVCFDKNGINMYTVGDQSEIYVFDLRKYRHCVNKFSDSGNFNTTFMDLSKDNSYLATCKYFLIFSFK